MYLIPARYRLCDTLLFHRLCDALLLLGHVLLEDCKKKSKVVLCAHCWCAALCPPFCLSTLTSHVVSPRAKDLGLLDKFSHFSSSESVYFAFDYPRKEIFHGQRILWWQCVLFNVSTFNTAVPLSCRHRRLMASVQFLLSFSVCTLSLPFWLLLRFLCLVFSSLAMKCLVPFLYLCCSGSAELTKSVGWCFFFLSDLENFWQVYL